MKTKSHNEWFRPIIKTTCECGEKKTTVWSWGEYVNGKWRTVEHFCEKCFDHISVRLLNHTKSCGCKVNIVGYNCILPSFLVKLQNKLNKMVCKV